MTPSQPSSSSGSANETQQDDQMAASSSLSYQPPSIYQSIMSRSTPLSSAHYTAQAALHNSVQLYGSNEVTNIPAGPLISDEIVENSSAADGTTRSSSHTPTYSNMTLGALTMRALPYPQPWSRSNANPTELPPNFDWLSESCGSKAAAELWDYSWVYLWEHLPI